ncbi:hypothetical protein ACWEBX_37925 [Streptomyces sp. NPDC005070]
MVSNTLGIKVVGGPFNGQTKIVQLSPDGTPPTPLRASGRRAGRDHHIYEAVRAADAPAGWICSHTSIDPTPTT